MTLRQYCEQMGLRLEFRRAREGWTCDIPGFSRVGGALPAVGPTKKAAYTTLARHVSNAILRQLNRPTTLYWVPELETR